MARTGRKASISKDCHIVLTNLPLFDMACTRQSIANRSFGDRLLPTEYGNGLPPYEIVQFFGKVVSVFLYSDPRDFRLLPPRRPR